MVVSALCVLILLASYITSAGQATKLPYNQATMESVLSMMNSADIGSDSGKMICNVECTRRYEVCIVAHSGNDLVDCGSRITGNYTCLCSNPSRVVGVIPTPEQLKSYFLLYQYNPEAKVEGSKTGGYSAIGDVQQTSNGSSSGGTPSVSSLLPPEDKETFEQLNKDIQDKIGIVYQNPEDIGPLFDICKGNVDCVAGGVEVGYNEWVKNTQLDTNIQDNTIPSGTDAYK